MGVGVAGGVKRWGWGLMQEMPLMLLYSLDIMYFVFPQALQFSKGLMPPFHMNTVLEKKSDALQSNTR